MEALWGYTEECHKPFILVCMYVDLQPLIYVLLPRVTVCVRSVGLDSRASTFHTENCNSDGLRV